MKNKTDETVSLESTPNVGDVVIAGVRFREYLKAIALPIAVMVILNIKNLQQDPEQTNIFAGNIRFGIANFVLLALPSIFFILWKHERVWSAAVVGGMLGFIGGCVISILRFAFVGKFYFFFNIMVETALVGVAGAVIGMLAWFCARSAKRVFPRLQGGMKQWRQKHARA